jgi:hypothetical protein
MLTTKKIEKCSNCGSIDIVKNGFTPYGNQRIKCDNCKKSPVLHRKKAPNYDKECVVRSFLERLSLCGVSRVFLFLKAQHWQEFCRSNRVEVGQFWILPEVAYFCSVFQTKKAARKGE